MLSLERCREIVGRGSDAELDLAREQLYALADVVIHAFVEHRASEQGPGAEFADALKLLPCEHADDATERAAIIEFEAGRNWDEAERQAILAVVGRHRGEREEP